MTERGSMERTTCFDAVVEFASPTGEDIHSVLLSLGEVSVPVSLHFYEESTEGGQKSAFVQVLSSQPLSLRWKQRFTIKSPDGREKWGEGMVLDPFAEKAGRRAGKRRLKYLEDLRGSEKEMLSAVIGFRGIYGVQQKEFDRFIHPSKRSLLELCQELETEGKIRILEFSPLFVVSQSAMAFLCDKILYFLEKYHEKHPDDLGIQKEKIQSRFDVHLRIMALALKSLVQNGQIKVKGDRVALFSFEMSLLPEEKKMLDRLEEIYLKDKFQSVSLVELQRSFRFSQERLDKLLTLLTERKKIVCGRDGFILHSRWLDEIVQKLRNSGKKELTVSEFKEMTGLTRKYAIPLLELLDQMRITRRRGAVREILNGGKT